MTRRSIYNFYIKYAAISFLLIFAAVQFFLILRHKSPYLSDSYFYKNIFYQFQGDNFFQAREKIIKQINLDSADEITRNIFQNRQSYQNSYSFFTKRPLYPFLALIFYLFTNNEYWSFLLPVFIVYLASIFLVFNFTKQGLGYFPSVISTALFIAFYPYLDWSTYFLTDTIGFFFWLLQLFFVYKLFLERKQKWFLYYVFVLFLSLLNREQSLLMIILFLFLYLFFNLFRFPINSKKELFKLLLSTLAIAFLYILVLLILKQRTIWDTLVYTQNRYGLDHDTYTLQETILFIMNSVKTAHLVFVQDLVRHHWWFAFSILALIGVVKTFLFSTKRKILDSIIISQAVSSYFFIFIYPVLSYRFYFPIVFAIIYFSFKSILEYNRQYEKYSAKLLR